MRPDRNTLEIESTLQGEDVRMGIAAGAEAHIMSILTDLYEDPEMACIREYSTNAWDAHVEAGQDRPIEVTTPSALRPLLTIKDFGIGLDAEGIRSIYSQYGASTKRGTNEQTGMLGVGCKSALTYTDQFTIVAVKDGTKTTVSVSRDEDGAGTMKILKEEDTGELPSVEVQVPTRRNHAFQKKAAWFFAFWEKGQVLLNGSDPAGLDGYQLTQSIEVVEGEDFEHDYLVMGNVPYPTDLGLYQRSTYSYGRNLNKAVVARVGIGALTFTPSREGLQDTERTRQCQADVKREFAQAAKDAVQRDVDAAASRAEALQAYITATDTLPAAAHPPVDSITYKGDPLPAWDKVWTHDTVRNSGYANSSGTWEPRLDQVTTGLWITNYTNGNWAKNQRDKLLAYIDEETALGDDQKRRSLFLVPTPQPPHADWIPDSQIIDWADIKAWQPPFDPNNPQGAPRAKRTGIYYGFRPGSQYVQDIPAADIDTSVPIYWQQKRKYQGGSGRRDLENALPDGAKFYLFNLPQNRVKKFEKDFPKAKEATLFLKQLAEKRRKALTDADREAMSFNGSDDWALLDPAKVDDPALKRAIAVAERADENSVKYAALRSEGYKYNLGEIKLPKPNPEWEMLEKRYTLIDPVMQYRSDVPADLYLYINAAYAARKE